MWLPASGRPRSSPSTASARPTASIAQPGIASIEDLAGKKVAIPEGTSGDMIVQLALEAAGMSIEDIEKVAMDAATVVSAFSSGQVDAAGIWYPMIDNIKDRCRSWSSSPRTPTSPTSCSSRTSWSPVRITPRRTGRPPSRCSRCCARRWTTEVDNLDATIELVATMIELDAEAVAGYASNGEYYQGRRPRRPGRRRHHRDVADPP